MARGDGGRQNNDRNCPLVLYNSKNPTLMPPEVAHQPGLAISPNFSSTLSRNSLKIWYKLKYESYGVKKEAKYTNLNGTE
jgi:hypothetical protein